MENKITLTIGEQRLTLVAQEDEAYVRKVAALVDSRLRELQAGGHMSLVTAALLCAMNLGDDYYKSLQGAENLRSQLRQYLETSARLQMENDELRRELRALRSGEKKDGSQTVLPL